MTISDFSATVSDDAKAKVSSIIKVNNGSLSIQDGFAVTTGTVAIEIGETATLEGLQVSGNLSSVSVVVNEANKEKDKIANKVVDDTGATVETDSGTINEKYVAINPATYDGYETLSDAIKNIPDGGTIKLINDVLLSERLTVKEKTLTLDLNGKTIAGDNEIIAKAGLLLLDNNSEVTIDDTSEEKTGTIDGSTDRLFTDEDNKQYYAIYNAVTVWPDEGNTASLIINNGRFIGEYYALAGNGKSITGGNISVVINNGYFQSNDGAAIYHPHNGDLAINGGEFIGDDTAIEIRAGNLKIEGGSFTAIKTPSDSTPNGNGTTSTGSAIAIAQHTSKLPITVAITGGEFNGYSAIYESNPQKNTEDDLEKISIDIEGGTFNATNGGTAVIYSEDKTAFISGGTFNTEPDESYIAADHHVVQSGSNWTVLAD